MAKEKKKRMVGVSKVTFIYKASVEADLQAVHHTTKQFVLQKAWEECVEANKELKDATLVVTFKNHVEVAQQRLRKPTRVELEAICGI